MAVPRNIIRFLGRYSEGIRLASEHGPTSGVLLEYAYRNEPHGYGAVGRWIDHTFLGLRTWHDLRQRMETTKEIVAALVAQRRAAGLPTLILDVASGTARYLRDLALEQGGEDVVIVCHDRDPRLVVHGRGLAAAEGLRRISFSVGDATDDSSYLTSEDPNIVLAIDLFPYLHSDAAVRTVMRLTFDHLSGGGCFLCTTLAKPSTGLTTWDTDSFAARPVVRSAETVAEWLRAAGFVNIDQRFSQPHGFALIGWKPKKS